MIETLFKFLSFDKIDKQLVKKIPYHLFIFLLFSIFGIFTFPEQTVQIILFISLFSFMVFNGLFNRRLNQHFKDYLDYAEFDSFISNLSGILDGTKSLFSEGYDKWKVAKTFGLMILSGGSLFIFNMSVFALLFYYFEITIAIQYLIVGILLFFIYSDLSKLDFLDQDETLKQKHSFLLDIMEKFTVTNPMEKLPFSIALRYLVFFCLRLISPIAIFKFPPPYSKVLFYYREPDFDNMIMDYVKAKEGIVFKELKKERSFSLHTILTNKNPSSLLTLQDRNVKRSFPFLFDPHYYDIYKSEEAAKNKKMDKGKSKKNEPPKPKPDAEMKYTVLRVLSKTRNGEEETMGYLFIRLFHGIFIKRIFEKVSIDGFRRFKEDESHVFKDIQKRFVYCIIIIGKQDIMEGIEKIFSTSASKVQAEAFGVEAGNLKDYSQR